MSTLISVTIDKKTKLQGYLAIDSTVNGRCHGGLRMAPGLQPESIVQAARVMTLKYGFTGLPVGGAKAGIAADPEMPQDRKRDLLKSFGRAIEPFLKTRSYIPSGDLGTTDDDIRVMLSSLGLKTQPRSLTFRTSGYYTSITVFAAAFRAAQHIGLNLERASVAIEGFGSVGSSTARQFWERGIKVVAISTSKGAIYNKNGLNIDQLLKLRDQAGSQVVNSSPGGEKIDKSLLAELDADIFCPCAQAYSLSSKNADRVAARIVSAGANVPLTAEAEQILSRRGIIYIPDFVANCGGVLGVSMKRSGLKETYIRRFLEQRAGEQVTKAIKGGEEENISPRIYAQRIAQARFLKAKAAAERTSIAGRAFGLALELYRRGIIPYQLVTPVAARDFEKRFD